MSSIEYPKSSDATSTFTRNDNDDTHTKIVDYESVTPTTTSSVKAVITSTSNSTSSKTTTGDCTYTQECLDQKQQQQQHTLISPKSFPLQTQKQNHPIQQQLQQQVYPATRKPPLLPKQSLASSKNNEEIAIGSRKTTSTSRRIDRTNKNNNTKNNNNSHNDTTGSKHSLMRSKSSNDDFNDLLRLDQLLLSSPEKTTTTKITDSSTNLNHNLEHNQNQPLHYSDSTRRRVLSRHQSSDPSTIYLGHHPKQQHAQNPKLLRAPSPNSKRVNDIATMRKLRDSSFTLNLDCEQQAQQQQQNNTLYDSFWYDNENNSNNNNKQNDNHDTILDDESISSKTRQVKLQRNHSVPFNNNINGNENNTIATTTATNIAAITATATTIYNTLRRYKSSQICIPNQLLQQQQQQQQQIVQLNGINCNQQQQQNQKLQKQKLVQRIWKVCSTFCCRKDKYITMFIGIALIVQILFLSYVNIQYVTMTNKDSNTIFTIHNDLLLLSTTTTNTTSKDTFLNTTIQSNMSTDQNQRGIGSTSDDVKASIVKEEELQHLVETQSLSANDNNNNNNGIDNDTIKNDENDLTVATTKDDENSDEQDINEARYDLLDLYYLDDDNDVNTSNINSSRVLCMIRVLGSCSVPGMEWLSYYGWFEDKELSNNLYYPNSISTIVQNIIKQQHTTTRNVIQRKQQQQYNNSTTSWFRRWRNLKNTTNKDQQQQQYRRRVFVQTKNDCYKRQQFWNATCIPTIIPHSTVQVHYDNDKYYNISIQNHEQYLKEQINAQQQWKGSSTSATTTSSTSSTTMTNISTITKSTLFQPYFATCKLRITGNDVTKECQDYFTTHIPTMTTTSSKENNFDDNTDDTYDDTSISGGWFDDNVVGNGPKPSTWWNCRQRRRYWIEFCSITKYDTISFVDTTSDIDNDVDHANDDVVTVEMDYTGPGIPTNIKEDGSWEIIDIDSATLHFMPTTILSTTTSSYQSCYRMTRKPALPYVPHVDFCYPTINIIGIDTRYTNSGSCNSSMDCQLNFNFGNLLSSILTNTSQSTKVLTATPSTSYCRIVDDSMLDNGNDLHEFPLNHKQEGQIQQQHQRTYYRYFHGFTTMTKEVELIHNKWKYNKLQKVMSLDDSSHDENDNDDGHKSNDLPPTTILVNVCNSPEEVMEYDVLLNGPKSLIVYIVQDVTTTLYSKYLHSQLNSSTENIKSALNFHSMILSANNTTEQLPINSTLINDPSEEHFELNNTDFKAMLHQNRISNYYSRYIRQIETSIPAQFVHLISAERLQSNAKNVVIDLSAILHTRLGYNLPELDITRTSSTSVNIDDMDAIGEKRQLDDNKDDIRVLTETKDLIGYWWDECLELSNRTKYTYPHCHASGYVKSKHFVKRKNEMSSTVPIQDLYLTVWSDQITSWFGQVGQSFEMTKLTSFLKDAKQVGFSSVMTDIGWTMTTPGTGDTIQFHQGMTKSSFDLLSEVCEHNMSLHIVLTTHQLPNWIQLQKKGSNDYFNETDASSCTEMNNNPHLSSFLDTTEWKLRMRYIMFATETLLQKYGTCIHSITPSISGEHRYSASHVAIRSNTTSVQSAFRKWQLEKNVVDNITLAVDPPELNCGTQCQPILNQQSVLWFGFQETMLADKYIELCTVVVNSATRLARKGGYKNIETTCSIRIVGDNMFSTSIAKGSNILFRLLKATYIKDVTVRAEQNTNNGVPLSPSIIAMLLGAIHPYGKKINFETSVSPFVTCGNTHEGVHVAATVSRFHFKTWLQYALGATVHGIGFSDLCSPLSLIRILSHETYSNKLQNSQTIEDIDEEQVPTQVSKIRLQTSSTFEYSALIYYPYRALYAWSSIISGETCGTSHSRCWHSSLEQHDVTKMIEFQGLKTLPYGVCPSDQAQNELIQVWDNLRIEHEHVAIFGDINMLSEDVLNKVDTIISITYPCVMTSNEWSMYEGESSRQVFVEKSSVYDFHQHLLNMPHKC